MENLINFTNADIGTVRTLVIEDEPWFVAKDVAEILGYCETAMMTRRLDDDEMSKIKSAELTDMSQQFGNNDIIIINESGLYSSVIGSKKPEAKRFKKWITSEVLPAIRKNGGYIAEKKDESPEDLMARALIVAGETLKRKEQRLLELESKIIADTPKVEFFDAVADSKDAVEISVVAKVIGMKGMGRNNLFAFLRDNNILRQNNQPYQTYVDRNWFRVIEQKYNKPDGSICINIKTLVYQKGVDGIRRLLEEKGDCQ